MNGAITFGSTPRGSWRSEDRLQNGRALARFDAVPALALGIALGLAAGAAAGAFGNRHALVIGLDGVRADALQVAQAPHLHALAASGTVSWEGFSGGVLGTVTQQATVSGPSWASIITGVWANRHGIRDNGFAGYDAATYPHFFRRLRESHPQAYLSSIVEWPPVDTYLVGPVAADVSFRSIALDCVTSDLVSQAVEHLRTADPDVLFLYFDAPDCAGHAYGYSPTSEFYLAVLAEVDAGIGEILDALRARPNYALEDWLVVVTADHGGLGTGHGGQTDDERWVPFIVSGGGVPRQTYAPGPGIAAVPPTVLAHLGVPIRSSWNWAEAPFGFGASNPLTNGLVAYLNFDDHLDLAGSVTNETKILAGTPRFVPGLLGSAARFDNRNPDQSPPGDWALSLGNLDSLYARSFSFSAWVRVFGNMNAAFLGNRDWSSGTNVGWCLTTALGQTLDYAPAPGGPLHRRSVDLLAPPDYGQWHLVTVTWDRPANQIVAYVDGAPRGTGEFSPNVRAGLGAGFDTLVGASGPGLRPGQADIDDLGFWNRVLSPDEVAAIYTQGVHGQSLVGSGIVPPAFRREPVPQTVLAGADVIMSVEVTGKAMNLQWLRDGAELSGATFPSLALRRVTGNDGGLYAVRVTNASGSVTSRSARLVVIEPSRQQVVGQWDFESGDLRATTGEPLVPVDAAVANDLAFGTTDAFGIPGLQGQSVPVLRLAPGNSTWGGLRLRHAAPPNGGGLRVNQYALIFDLLYPAGSDRRWRALYQTDPRNQTDAELFVDPANGLGISSSYQGNVTANAWHRLIVAVDLPTATMTKYIDGAVVGSQALNEGVDARWALGPELLVFADNDGEVTPVYVSSVQFRTGPFSPADAAALGPPTATKVPGSITIRLDAGAVLVHRTGAAGLERADDLQGAWTEIPNAPDPYPVPLGQTTRQFYRPKLR